MDILKFPIGKFEKPKIITKEILDNYITDIADFPVRLRHEVQNLSEAQLDTPYRPHGWTVRQLTHHCADSHLNSYIRFKLALTEDNPTIKPYDEAAWATLQYTQKMPVAPTLALLDSLHYRWVLLLNSLTTDQLSRSFTHPAHNEIFYLDENIGIYAWHCRHHLAHIINLKKTQKWH